MERNTACSIARAISDGAARLDGIADNPRLEARLLLARALGVTRNDLIRDPGRTIETTGFEALLSRRVARANRSPLSSVAANSGVWIFWSPPPRSSLGQIRKP